MGMTVVPTSQGCFGVHCDKSMHPRGDDREMQCFPPCSAPPRPVPFWNNPDLQPTGEAGSCGARGRNRVSGRFLRLSSWGSSQPFLRLRGHADQTAPVLGSTHKGHFRPRARHCSGDRKRAGLTWSDWVWGHGGGCDPRHSKARDRSGTSNGSATRVDGVLRAPCTRTVKHPH